MGRRTVEAVLYGFAALGRLHTFFYAEPPFSLLGQTKPGRFHLICLGNEQHWESAAVYIGLGWRGIPKLSLDQLVIKAAPSICFPSTSLSLAPSLHYHDNDTCARVLDHVFGLSRV
jgi:hypothetical protein